MIRHATAVWNGTGKEGKGQVTTASNALNNTPYNYRMRFEDEQGTNPEELVAAAHAGCFNMKLSFVLGNAGFTPDKLETKCEIHFDGKKITKSHLTVNGSIPGIDQQKFEECVKDAKENCPISQLLNAEITTDISLS